MKLLRNSFALIIAVCTVTLTIAAHAGIFKPAADITKQQFDCDPANSPAQAQFVNLYDSNCLLTDPDCIDGNLPELYAQVNQSFTPFDCQPIANPPICCVEVNVNVECAEGRFLVENMLCGEIIEP